MDRTDFSKGIILDLSPEDSGENALVESVNLDHWPGVSRKRRGTNMRFIELFTYDPTTKTHTFTGFVIPTAGEEIVQIEETSVPDAREGSIKNYIGAPTFTTPPVEHCLNTEVTIIMTHVTGRTYRCYGDVYARDKFVLLAEFEGADDSVPFMITHQSCVDIGNVITSKGERGVLWLGHIKGLYCWTREFNTTTGLYEYGYLNWVDEWRLSDAECFNADDNIFVSLLVSNVEQSWDHNSDMALDFRARYGLRHEDLMRELLSSYQLGGRETSLKIKVTGIYDGFQETRPLPWTGGHALQQFQYNSGTSAIEAGKASLPDNWTISFDSGKEHFARIRMRPVKKRTTWAHTFDMPGGLFNYGAPFEPTDNLGGNRLKWYVKLMWLQEWQENGSPFETGEGFLLQLFADDVANREPTGSYGHGLYSWGFDKEKRTVLNIYRTAIAISPTTGRPALLNFDFTMNYLLFVLGASDEFPSARYFQGTWLPGSTSLTESERDAIVQNWEAWLPSVPMERNGIAQRISVAEWYHYLDTPHAYGSMTNSKMVPKRPILANGESVQLLTFGLENYSGRGILAIMPVMNGRGVLEPHGSTNVRLNAGLRRLTGFRIYVKEDDVDIDYTLRKEVFFSLNPADIDHGGTIEEANPRQTFRDGAGKNAPVFRKLLFGTEHLIVPYYENTFTPMAQFTGLSFRGGLSRDFILSDDDLTDLSGLSTLSGNLQRPERERDAPVWIRGAVCEGRTFGIRYVDRLIQYSVVAGGVPQHNIMPQSAIRVSRDEIPTHIVSWRGQFHMVFTDKGLHRFDLADGDEMRWRILDTFAGHGTVLWRTICNTPHGLYYVTRDGIFSYAGNSPIDMVYGFWKNRFRQHYSSLLEENNAFAGYNSGDQRILFALNPTSHTDHDIWVLDLRLKAWWKYRFRAMGTGYASPRYMRMWDGEFFLSFGKQDTRIISETRSDVAPGGYAYHAYMITSEFQPASQTDLAFHQYIGFKYKSKAGLRYKLGYGPYMEETPEFYYPYRSLKSVALPGGRDNFMHPMPMGISRLFRIMIGQGDVFFNKLGAPDENTHEDVEVRLISVRGSGMEQFNA
jgi:hypothetical protein